MSFPLTNARSAGIGHDECSNAPEVFKNAIALGGESDLFRPRVDDELPLHLYVFLVCLTSHRSSSAQVLVAGIGARPYQPHFNGHGIVVGRTFGFHLRDGGCSIGCERSVQMGFHLREVDVDNLVVEDGGVGEHCLVGTQLGRILACHHSHLFSSGFAQVFIGLFVEGEYAACGSQLGTHVADGGLAGGRDGTEPVAKIFQYGIGTPLHGEQSEYLKNHILGCSPT